MPENKTTRSKRQANGTDWVAFAIRFPASMYKKINELAFKKDISKTLYIIEIIEKELKKIK